jgi:hypothetical protein
MSENVSGPSFHAPFPTEQGNDVGKATVVAHFADLHSNSDAPSQPPRQETEATARGPPLVSTLTSGKSNSIHQHKEQELQ